MVTCGNFQHIEDHAECESPAASLNTVLILLSIAAKRQMCINVYDVTGAYLNADLKEPVYVKLNKSVASILVESNRSEFEQFLMDDGTMVVQLL